MKAKFSALKPYRLYKNLTIIFDTKVKQFENSILTVSPSKESTLDIMKSAIFQQNYIRGFYLDRFLDKSLYRKLIKTERNDVYKEVKDNTRITVAPLNIGIMRNKNAYYPSWMELENIFNIPGAHNKIRNTINLINTLKIVQGRIQPNLYKKNYVVIDAKLFGKEFGDMESDWIKGLNIGSMLYLHFRDILARKAYDEFIFAGKRIILYDVDTQSAFAIPENIEKLQLGKFKWMIRIMHKLVTKQEVTEEDMAEEEIAPSIRAGQKAYYVSLKSKANEITINKVMVFRSAAEAVEAYIKANFPEADFFLDDTVVNIELSENSAALEKAIRADKIGIYASAANLLDERIFKKVGLKFFVKKDSVFILDSAVSESSKCIRFQEPDEKPEIIKAKKEVLKDVKDIGPSIPLSFEEKEILSEIEDRVDEISVDSKDEKITEKATKDAIIKKLKHDLTAKRLAAVQSKTMEDVVSTLSTKQDEATITVNGVDVSLAEKIKDLEAKVLEPKEFKANVINKELNKSTAKALRESYLTDLYEKDQYKIFTQFKDSKDIPIFVESIVREDSSDSLNAKEELTVNFSIAKERPRKMKIEIPKIDADGFLYLQGSRKQVTNQIAMMPIVKIMQSGEIVVQYNTSYNKIFLSRTTGNLNRKVASFIKAISKLSLDRKNVTDNYKFITGSSYAANQGKLVNLEYLELSHKLVTIKIKDVEISLSQIHLQEIFEASNIDLEGNFEGIDKRDFFPIGKKGNIPLFAGVVDGVYTIDKGVPVRISDGISDLVVALASEYPNLMEYFTSNVYSGKSMSYTKLEVSNAYIPLIVFLAFKDGLEEILTTYDIEYIFVPKDTAKAMEVGSEFTESVKFEDGTLWYKPGTVRKDLLFYGIYQLPTKDFKFEDFKADGEGFYQFFVEKVTPRYGKALQNFYTLFIDPITVDVLKDSNIPTDITGSFLYCNDLLQDVTYRGRYDMNLYRIRNIECINAMLYKLVAKQIEKYRRGSRGDTAGTLAVRSDALIQELHASPIIEDATLLDPIKEAENLSKAVYKGPGAPAYQHAQGTEELRFFDKSQRGVFGIGSSFDGNSGMNRRIAMNSVITSKRGYVKSGLEDGQLDASNLYSLGELTATFSTRHSDPPRLMMTVGQSGHQISTVKMQRPMITTGAFKTISHFISNEFVFKALEDGVVEAIDPKLNAIHLSYADGTKGFIDLNVKYRRSPDGFYINIKQQSKLKKGERFKKGDILAADEHFFKLDGNNTEMKQGTITKIAVASQDMNVEDSASITESFAKKLHSKIVMQSSLVLSKNSNLLKIVKIGSDIRTSEPLAIFEENLEDASISEALSKMGSLAEEMGSLSTNSKTARYTGRIVDIEIFYNHEISEYSKSLQNLIKSYITAHTLRQKSLSQSINPKQFIEKRELERLRIGRAKGVPFDGIIINFYTETEEPFSIGSKVTWDTALKSIIGEIIPEGKEPVSEHRPEELIEAVMSPVSVLNRKTPDFFYRGFLQKVLMELKFKIGDIVNDG